METLEIPAAVAMNISVIIPILNEEKIDRSDAARAVNAPTA